MAQRRIVISQREPQIARELLIREALVNGFTRMKYEFLQHNQAQVDVVVESEQKTRRRDLLVGEDVLVDFYQERIRHVVSEASMRKWLQKLTDTSILKFDAAMLWHNEISSNALLAYPDTWQQGALTFPLTYVFSPNSEDDGVTVHIPLALLNQVTLNGFEWLVPGLRHELLVTLIKSLPKRLRRNFVPVPHYADACLAALEPTDGQGAYYALLPVLADKLSKMSGVPFEVEQWEGIVLPEHLQMRYAIVDEEGNTIRAGRDLLELKEALKARIQASLEQVATPELEQSGLVEWSFVDLRNLYP